jgi:hypothetical protein
VTRGLRTLADRTGRDRLDRDRVAAVGVIFAIESSGSAGAIALLLGVIGLLLVLAA